MSVWSGNRNIVKATVHLYGHLQVVVLQVHSRALDLGVEEGVPVLRLV